ncbi:MAG: phosphate-starvation-inducible PsiE family protein [Calditrichia bacterium]
MPARKLIQSLFPFGENFIYIVVGFLLIAASFFLVFDIFRIFLPFSDSGGLIRWALETIDKILLMLMIIEILYTMRASFKEHVLNAEPFLIVALIAAIRRILVISVESACLPEKFVNHMIEISILGVLTFIFVVPIIFFVAGPQQTHNLTKRIKEEVWTL